MRPSFLLLSGGTGRARWVHRAMAAAGASVREVASLPKGLGESTGVVVMGQGLPDGAALPMERVLLIADVARGPGLSLVLQAGVRHLIPASGPSRERDLFVACAGLMGREVGVAAHLLSSARTNTTGIASSMERDGILARIDDYLDRLQVQSRIRKAVLKAGDELIMNALYDAPVDEHGVRPFASLTRTEPVLLPERHAATVSWGADGALFGVSVQDPFGSLDPEKVLDHFSRGAAKGSGQISQAPGGAGLGLFVTLGTVTRLVFQVTPGVSTVVTALFDLGGSYRDLVSSPWSYGIFTRRPGQERGGM